MIKKLICHELNSQSSKFCAEIQHSATCSEERTRMSVPYLFHLINIYTWRIYLYYKPVKSLSPDSRCSECRKISCTYEPDVSILYLSKQLYFPRSELLSVLKSDMIIRSVSLLQRLFSSIVVRLSQIKCKLVFQRSFSPTWKPFTVCVSSTSVTRFPPAVENKL